MSSPGASGAARSMPARSTSGRSGVQSLTAGPDGIAVPPNDRLLVFAINTWQGWSSPAVDEFDILVNPDSSGQPAYVIGALDHGIVTNGTPDGVEGCFVLRVADDTDHRGHVHQGTGEQFHRPVRRARQRDRRRRQRVHLRRGVRLAGVADDGPAGRDSRRSTRSSRPSRRATTSPWDRAGARACPLWMEGSASARRRRRSAG